MKPLTDPLDTLFNISSTETNIEYAEVTEGDLVPAQQEQQEKDREDAEIDKKIDDVYDAAFSAFNSQTTYAEMIEPRYAARNAEVAAGFLTIALNAAATRAKVKGDRKRVSTFVPYSKTQNNVVVASREEIMRLISVDGEVKEIK